MGLRGGIAVFVVALALAPAAQAAQRYAAPAGAGPQPCSAAAPCSLKDALGGAKANDEVIVTAGAYSLSAPTDLSPEATGAYVHGDFAGPRPTITGSVSSYLLGVSTAKSRVAYLDITNAAEFSGAFKCDDEVTVERMRMVNKARVAFGAQAFGSCLVRDSVARAEGEQSAGIFAAGESPSFPGSFRNVTAIATGPKSIGMRVSSFAVGSSYTAFVRNSILSGEEFDLRSYSGVGAVGIDVAYSNFDTFKAEPGTTFSQGPGNQATPPLFLDAPAGDYREASGSPTVDAGAADQLAATDYDGNPRALGAAPDIGAFELVPPTSSATSTPSPVGTIRSLDVSPRRFRAAMGGEAVISRVTNPRAPVGTTVTYSLSGAATVVFKVERKTTGRRVKGKCVARTRANRERNKCRLYILLPANFTQTGAAGRNRFRFSGRLAGKPLKPGSYRLAGNAGPAAYRRTFTIVK